MQQSPISQFAKLGEDMKLNCQHDDSNYDRMYRYQQLHGQQGLDLLGFLFVKMSTRIKSMKQSFVCQGMQKAKGF